ncbi:uncharacterized protein LOC120296181 [Eucalyptus grandis]|uniref:uncharacterized protein LOC120296181 n=1 Tax=Eucalyptus grandis TaxID=71139 RepID=UPI00192EDF26|nr:uncharacterized protein LOC120296181 [Eucalyptus grandis]
MAEVDSTAEAGWKILDQKILECHRIPAIFLSNVRSRSFAPFPLQITPKNRSFLVFFFAKNDLFSCICIGLSSRPLPAVPRRSLPLAPPPPPLPHRRRTRQSPSEAAPSLGVARREEPRPSWADEDCATSDSDFNGWAVVESRPHRARKGLPTYVVGAVGTSLAVLLAVIAHYSLSRNGYSFRFVDRLRSWRSLLNQAETEAVVSEDLDSAVPDGKSIVSQDSPEGLSDLVSNNVVSDGLTSRDKQQRVIVPVAVDSTQQEAVMVLERLKVCFLEAKENDVSRKSCL